jgi:hypothetical protein
VLNVNSDHEELTFEDSEEPGRPPKSITDILWLIFHCYWAMLDSNKDST